MSEGSSAMSRAPGRCPQAHRVVAAIQLGTAVAVVGIWLFGLALGGMGTFDRFGLPAVGGLLAAMSVVAWTRPRFALTTARLPLLGVLMIYVQASLCFALFVEGPATDAQALSRLGLAMPLLYLASFALLVRRSYMLPALQGALASLQCLAGLLLGWGQAPADVLQSLFVMMVLQPLYLALLYWVNHQRREAIAAQAQAAASRMTMLAMVAHELRSPLQTITGSLNALERRMNGLGLPKAELAPIHRTRSAVAQLDSHLADLLVVTKPGGELSAARKEPFRLDRALQSLVESYLGAARDSGCLLRLEIGEGCEWVEGDAVRLHQVVNNLVNNAVKYTKEGEILVRAQRLDEREVQLSVCDTGIGVEPSKIAAIWEPHVRLVSDPHVSLTEGSGLGLAVVRRLIDMLGGRITVESEVGKGTEVVVCLPLPMSAAASEPAR